jgi:hypothetical protein
VLRQICNLIPAHLVGRLARETGVEERARTFTSWSHVVCLLYAQLTHAISLNDVCDALRLRASALLRIRGAVAPSANALSHANKVRNPQMAEGLLWAVLKHLQTVTSGFGAGRPRLGRFQRAVYAVDATVITLVANCMDWARHRRRKAATKLHLRLDLQTFLPRFAVLDLAPRHESSQAARLCAGLKSGEIALFDRAYTEFAHLYELQQRGVFWVTRAKDNLNCRVRRRLPVPEDGPILRDELITLRGVKSRQHYPGTLRRVVAEVEVEGQFTELVFLTNNLEWSAASIAELYRCRWDIEKFFRQLKQTLQLSDFLGNSAHAVHWQVWTALLVYVLLRYLAHVSSWNHSFTRLWAYLRSALWCKLDLLDLIKSCGTADGHFRLLGRPEQTYMPFAVG